MNEHEDEHPLVRIAVALESIAKDLYKLNNPPLIAGKYSDKETYNAPPGVKFQFDVI